MPASHEVLPVRGDNWSAEGFARNVCRGLAAVPKNISSRCFHDERGSRLF